MPNAYQQKWPQLVPDYRLAEKAAVCGPREFKVPHETINIHTAVINIT